MRGGLGTSPWTPLALFDFVVGYVCHKGLKSKKIFSKRHIVLDTPSTLVRIKMYHDLKKTYWWKRMKIDVAQYVASCGICQRVKAEHKSPAGKIAVLRGSYVALG